MPTMASFLKNGAKAAGNGLLTQAPPNTGAGWYTLATGAWPGVHGSTNNTFHINNQPFANRTSAFDTGVLQAESIAQSAERGGLKVAQVEWAGGRNATHQRPDDRLPRLLLGSRRRDELHRQPGRPARSSFIARSGCSSTTAGTPAGPFAGAGRPATAGPTSRRSARPGDAPPRARLRRRQVRPERLHLRLDQRLTTNYDKVLFSRDKNAADAVGDPRRGPDRRRQGHDRRRAVGRPDRRACSSRSRSSTATLSRVRLFHTSVSRAIATWPTWPGEPGLHRRLRRVPRPDVPDIDRSRLRGPRGRHRQRGDVRRAGPLLGDGHLPMLEYVAKTYKPDLLLVGHADDRRVPAPVPRPRQPDRARTAARTRRTTTSTSTA